MSESPLQQSRRSHRRMVNRLLSLERLECRQMLTVQAPIDLRVMPGNVAGEIMTAWSVPPSVNVASITGYSLQVSSNNGASWQAVGGNGSTATNTSIVGLNPSTAYVVRVAAVTAGGLGEWANYSASVSSGGFNSASHVEFVYVGNPGNQNDPATGSQYGAVSYDYRIGRQEITVAQYVTFLNAVARDGGSFFDTFGLYRPGMEALIARNGSPGTFTYQAVSGKSGDAVTNMIWFDAARFANWMSNGRPTGTQGPGTTENGAYNLVGTIVGASPAPARNVFNPNTGAAPTYWIPTESEWYKAAFYDPTLNSGSGGYWTYATRSSTSVSSTSYFGTVGQSSGVYDLTDGDGSVSLSRPARGGTMFVGPSLPSLVPSSERLFFSVSGSSNRLGFRLAAQANALPYVSSSIHTAPTSVSATVLANSSSLSWAPPQTAGAIQTLGYVVQVSANNGVTWQNASGSLGPIARSFIFSGLTAGQTHLGRVAAISPSGVGAFSQPLVVSQASTVSVPSAPSGVFATAGNGQASLTWTAPTSNGGAAITNYTVQYSSNAGSTWTTFTRPASTATSATVTGLNNGTTYVFRVAAVNSAGTGSYSANSNSVIPTGAIAAPAAPSNLIATAGNAQASLTWAPPISNGGAAITDYTVQYSANGGASWTTFNRAASTATSATVMGLTNGTAYVFRVAAVNSGGTGSFSVASNSVIPTAAIELESTPTGYAIRNNGQVVQITFNGSAASASNPGGGWTAIAARAANGGYEVLWRHTGGSFVQWTLNSQGAQTANNGFLTPQQVANWNNNGNLQFTPIGTANGAVEIGNTAAGYAVRNNGQVVQITFNGSAASASNPGAGWTAIAARAAGSGYEVLWQHPGGSFAQWTVNGFGARTGGGPLTPQQVQAVWANQTPFNPTAGGAIELLSTAAGYAIRNNGQVIPITYAGRPASDFNPGMGWTAISVRATGSGYDLLWRHTGGNFAQWILNSFGALVTALDLPGRTMATTWAGLGVNFQGQYVIRSGGGEIPITLNGTATSASNPGGGWTAIAARAAGSGYELLWQHAGGSFVQWTLNGSGAFIRRLPQTRAQVRAGW